MKVHELIDALRSLPHDYEVVVIDNYSEDAKPATRVEIDSLEKTVFIATEE